MRAQPSRAAEHCAASPASRWSIDGEPWRDRKPRLFGARSGGWRHIASFGDAAARLDAWRWSAARPGSSAWRRFATRAAGHDRGAWRTARRAGSVRAPVLGALSDRSRFSTRRSEARVSMSCVAAVAIAVALAVLVNYGGVSSTAASARWFGRFRGGSRRSRRNPLGAWRRTRARVTCSPDRAPAASYRLLGKLVNSTRW